MKLSTRIISLALAVFIVVACAAPASSDGAVSSDPPTMFFNITSGPDNPHPVTMALQLAGHSLDDGREVVLFFNVQGVHVPTNELSETLAFGDEPIKMMLAGLIERGAHVHVCPHCMAALEVEEADLVEGAQVTTRESLFAHVHSNTTVFTY